MTSTITAIGTYTPEKTLSNEDFEKMVDTNDEWITKRTGIKERKIAENESTVEMAEKASRDLSSRFGKDLSDVDFIIVASSTGEHRIPSLASQLQAKLNIKNTGCIDLIAACAGFTYAVSFAQSLIASQFYKKILVIACEKLSAYTDYEDRATCILFGDGAAAALIEPNADANLYKPLSGTEGENGHVLYSSGYTKKLNDVEIKTNDKIVQDGRTVYKWAVSRMSQKFDELLSLNNLTANDIDFFVPHSANLRIIEGICRNVNLPIEKTLESVINYGNTSAVSIPLAIDQALKAGKLKKGNKLMLLGFGGGLTYAGAIIDWMID